MSAIGKWFAHEGEAYTVSEQTINGYVCRNHQDHKLWVFSFAEIRKILSDGIDPDSWHLAPEEH